MCGHLTACAAAPSAQDFGRNYAGDPKVKIPWVRRELCGSRILVMEWIDGLRCTDPRGIQSSGIDVDEFTRCGVVSGLRQLLEVPSADLSNPRIKYCSPDLYKPRVRLC